ncbi:unnamed protein product [Clonostachys rosea]|uniref:Heterokaryon incompatibility domain-containing protein n=1 Tax=Bionectria ochroleuca TaxID=29856 RepID=A0ABY6UJH6_BIOOC|nr:unnamed protein product [Clonostachys rosea]
MRLINAHTLALEEFLGASIPKYAILSHTWGSEEILLADWTEIEAASKELEVEFAPAKAGYAKIKNVLKQAIQDGLDYLWVDTNCIDKPNWSELAETINSMFAWYRDSVVCYAYLEDLNEFSVPPTRQELQGCRWFTRGWTLQELLAPDQVNFYSGDWTFLGSKNDLADMIKDITGIPKSFITGNIAYCMLGILDVNMPLIYGEGYKAFIRLQEEIIKSSADESLFRWTFDNTVPTDWVSVLAPSPTVFRDSSNFEPYRLFRGRVSSYSVTNQGLSISLPLIEVKDGFLGLLNVLSLTRGAGAVAIFLQGDLTSGVLTRARSPGAPIRLPGSMAVLSSYLMPVEHTREHVFIRSKIGLIKPLPATPKPVQSATPTNIHHGSRYQVLLLTEGKPFVTANTFTHGRISSGCVLNIQPSDTAPTDSWFCKVLDPYEGDITSLSETQLKKMAYDDQSSEQLSDDSRDDVKLQIGEEFDAGVNFRMRVAHISVRPEASRSAAGINFGLGFPRLGSGNIWKYARTILDKDST